ncbi:hypothetical protein BSNK01_03530 [Bacillaceae bacterium]
MKITSLTLRVHEHDFDLYEDVLKKMGWMEHPNRVFRKTFGDTLVEIREHLPAFGTNLELVVSLQNPKGCSLEEIFNLLKDLRDADTTPDEEEGK